MRLHMSHFFFSRAVAGIGVLIMLQSAQAQQVATTVDHDAAIETPTLPEQGPILEENRVAFLDQQGNVMFGDGDEKRALIKRVPKKRQHSQRKGGADGPTKLGIDEQKE